MMMASSSSARTFGQFRRTFGQFRRTFGPLDDLRPTVPTNQANNDSPNAEGGRAWQSKGIQTTHEACCALDGTRPTAWSLRMPAYQLPLGETCVVRSRPNLATNLRGTSK